jgi:hypothetical protein
MLGLCVIGLSGVVLWIPETVTRVVPGWTINIAQMIHSDEALLAIAFVLTFHVFHFSVLDKLLLPRRHTDRASQGAQEFTPAMAKLESRTHG